ncbi:MBG domain-containing protein, partial [Geomonas sp.]|uniref:MBG domain-containing protein n=1 Tax=Geomonas sp. TaxID=2651584 RepID=UPI002B4804FD
IRINGAGSTLITLSQPGNATFNPAPVVTIPMNVLKAPLTVTADNKARAYQTTNPPLTASYAGFVNGDGVEVVEGGPVLTTASSQSSPVGSYPIVVDTAAMAAANYRFLPVNGTLTVYRSCQLIIFPPLADKTFGDPPFSVSASSCSGLGISFTSSNPQVALVVGNVVTVTGAGSAFITASQTGSDSVEQAPAVSQLLVIHRSGQSVNFPPLPRKVLGEAPFTLAATASSALAVSYRSSDLSVATVSGNTVTILRAGTTVITASQAGNNNYEAALPASQPLTAVVEGEPPTLSLSTLSVGAVTADPVFNLTGSATDASGIASLTVNGVDLTDRAAFFSSAIPLLAGDNNITVAVRDGAGNTASETVTVTFDSTVPVIALSSPADNSVTNASLIPVAGSVPPGCAVTMAVNAGAPQNLPVAGGTFSGTAGLEPGLNTIELAATLQGQVSRVKRSVTFAPGLPSVAIEEPGEDLQSDQESLMIRGSSNMQGSGLAVTIDADGTLFTSDLLQGSFQQRIPLNRGGVTHVSAIVTDGSGNTSVAYRNIVSSPKPWGDLNGDGRVDLTDAMLALRLSIGLDPLTVDALARADVAPLVNGVPQPDGMLDVGDVVVILRKVVGLVDF